MVGFSQSNLIDLDSIFGNPFAVKKPELEKKDEEKVFKCFFNNFKIFIFRKILFMNLQILQNLLMK